MTTATTFHEANLTATPIRNLGLTIAGTRLEGIIADFEKELHQAGRRRLRPRFYLTTEWGVPFDTIVIGIPWYLVRPDLTALHEQYTGYVEGVSREDILRYLRHEMGHVVNYGYRLYDAEDWIKHFGAITQPYEEDYRSEPFSRRYVRHLPGWYAQKHPDEDWAETFAVWMTPGADWHSEYADWHGLPSSSGSGVEPCRGGANPVPTPEPRGTHVRLSWTQVHLGRPGRLVIIRGDAAYGISKDLQGGSVMSMTLNLAQRLLALGQNYQQLGRNHDALRYLGRLAGFRDLEPGVAEHTQISLAEIYLARRHYHKARRHLTAALAHQPNNARYHHLMAVAWAADEKGDRRRAADHYRQALRLDPDQPHCLSEFGLLALEIGQTEEGFQSLFRAVELAPNDPLVVGRLAEGLVQEDRIEEARRVLQAALFRNSRDARFRKLWNNFQFQQLQQQQQRRGYAADAADADDQGPTLLPFVRVVPQAGAAPGPAKIIRCDGPAAPAAPHKAGRRGLPRRRHAQ